MDLIVPQINCCSFGVKLVVVFVFVVVVVVMFVGVVVVVVIVGYVTVNRMVVVVVEVVVVNVVVEVVAVAVVVVVGCHYHCYCCQRAPNVNSIRYRSAVIAGGTYMHVFPADCSVKVLPVTTFAMLFATVFARSFSFFLLPC